MFKSKQHTKYDLMGPKTYLDNVLVRGDILQSLHRHHALDLAVVRIKIRLCFIDINGNE